MWISEDSMCIQSKKIESKRVQCESKREFNVHWISEDSMYTESQKIQRTLNLRMYIESKKIQCESQKIHQCAFESRRFNVNLRRFNSKKNQCESKIIHCALNLREFHCESKREFYVQWN